MSDPIRDNTERSRYELEIDGQIVFANYRRDGATLSILHVEAPLTLRELEFLNPPISRINIPHLLHLQIFPVTLGFSNV